MHATINGAHADVAMRAAAAARSRPGLSVLDERMPILMDIDQMRCRQATWALIEHVALTA